MLTKVLQSSLIVFIVTFSSCSTDTERMADKNLYDSPTTKHIKLVSLKEDYSFKSAGNADYILEFSSGAKYDSTIEELSTEMREWDNSFVAQYSDLSDEELNDKEHEIGFNQFQPLENFEQNFENFQSLRPDYIMAENEWLDNDSLDLENDPASDFYYLDYEELTLLNKDAAVIVDSSIIIFTEDGLIEIKNRDIETYNDYLVGEDISDHPNYVNHHETTSHKQNNNCRSGVRMRKWDGYKHNHGAKIILLFRSYPWVTKSKVKVVSYKYKKQWLFGGRNWKRYRTTLGAASETKFFDKSNCTLASSKFKPWKFKRRKSLSRNAPNWGFMNGLRAKNGQSVLGNFYYNGSSSAWWLTW